MKQFIIGLSLALFIPCGAMSQLVHKKLEEGVTKDRKHFYQLVWAVLFEHVDTVDRFLAEGAYVWAACNQQLPSGKTVLHLAVVPGWNTAEGHANRMRITRALLAAGVSLDVRDIGGCTARDSFEGYGEFEGKAEIRALLTGQ